MKIEGDERKLSAEVVREWRYLYPQIIEIHVWFGFPCGGLSSLRAGRLNLEDYESGLFWEVIRILKRIRLGRSLDTVSGCCMLVKMWLAWMHPRLLRSLRRWGASLFAWTLRALFQSTGQGSAGRMRNLNQWMVSLWKKIGGMICRWLGGPQEFKARWRKDPPGLGLNVGQLFQPA